MVARIIVVVEIVSSLSLLLALYCGAVGSDASDILPNNTLVVTAYQTISEVYVDGMSQTVVNGDTWSEPDYFAVSSNSRLVAMRAVNLGTISCAGIIASIHPDYLLTNSEWKCIQSAGTGWFALGFDDSNWPNAVEYGDNSNGHSTCTEGAMKVAGISPNAKWIWGSDPTLEVVMYCRGYTGYCETSSPCMNGGTCLKNDEKVCQCLPQFLGEFCEIDNNATLVVTAYQFLENVFVDGISQGIPNADAWSVPDYINVSSSSRLVAMSAINLYITCSGIIASIQPDYLLTTINWKCSDVGPSGWSDLGFDDSSWPNAVEYGDNFNGHSSCTDGALKVEDISPTAKWIWGNDPLLQIIIYCRGYTPYCETSSPCLNSGTCLRNDQRMCDCPPQFTGEFCEKVVTINDTLVVTAYKSLYGVYVDGINQSTSNGEVWSMPDYINVSSNSRLVAVAAVNLGTIDCAGVIASINPEILLTDKNWKCIDSAPNGWFDLGFDDSSWPNAVEYGDNTNGHGNCSDGALTVAGINPYSKWIWGNNPQLQIMTHCRGYIPYCETSSPCMNGGTCLQNNQEICQCLPQFTGEFCELGILPNDTLVATAYQTLNELYVDGISQTILSGDTWSVPDYINVSSNSRLVALSAISMAMPPCAGIIASIHPDILLTDRNWKCVDAGPTGWSDLGFDDSSWPNAVEYGDNANGHKNCSEAMKVVNISPDAKWIWGTNPTLQIIICCRGYTNYCERSSPCLNGGTCLQNNQAICQCLSQFTGEFCETAVPENDTLVITAYQNMLEVYIDGNLQTISNGASWDIPDKLSLSSNSRLVAVYARNMANPLCSGVLASAYPDFVLTNNQWKCTISQIDNWFELGFDDSTWPNAIQYGDNTNGHSNCQAMKVTDISLDAKWIWTDNVNDFGAYCRGYTAYCESSSPCLNGGTCLQNNQTVCECLPQFTGEFCETDVTPVLIITAKSMLYDLFIDGQKMNVSHGNDVSVPDQVAVPTHSMLIAVTALDTTATCAGLLASIYDDYFLSNATWKCVTDIPPMWYTLGFDDSSWSNAYVIGPNGNVTTPAACEILDGIPSISPKASWIWTPSISNAPLYDDIINCRAYLPTCDDESICKNGGTCNRNSEALCSCVPGYAGTYCENDLKRTLTITAKSYIHQLYIDGNEITLLNGNNWTMVDNISLSTTNRLIAVLATDSTETCAGLIASVTDDFLVTDATWKCDIGAPPQWYFLGFDDSSWPNAYVVGPNDNVTWPEPCKVLPKIPEISPKANWIWTSTIPDTPFYDQVVYCRAYIPLCDQENLCQNGGTCLENSDNFCICPPGFSGAYCESDLKRTLTITAKSYIHQLYIDGNEITLLNGNNWTVIDNISLSTTNRLIAVLATDSTETCAGLIASVTDDYLVTDATWKCDIGAPPDWFLLGFDDSSWPNAYVIGPNDGVTSPEPCKVLPEIPEISQKANWIWTSTIPATPLYDQVVYCRAYLPLCDQGIQCQNGGTCLENSVNLCICPPGFSGVYCESETSAVELK